jgi:hypothetical protein
MGEITGWKVFSYFLLLLLTIKPLSYASSLLPGHEENGNGFSSELYVQ